MLYCPNITYWLLWWIMFVCIFYVFVMLPEKYFYLLLLFWILNNFRNFWAIPIIFKTKSENFPIIWNPFSKYWSIKGPSNLFLFLFRWYKDRRLSTWKCFWLPLIKLYQLKIFFYNLNIYIFQICVFKTIISLNIFNNFVHLNVILFLLVIGYKKNIIIIAIKIIKSTCRNHSSSFLKVRPKIYPLIIFWI